VTLDHQARFGDLFGAFLSPVGHASGPRGHLVRAERLPSLTGKRIGLLWNTKLNSELMLVELGRLLAEQYDAVVTARQAPYAHAVPLDGPDLVSLIDSCDLALVGVGDCGSCAAAAVNDGMALERHGIPAAVICSDAFDVTARATAEVQGDPDYPFLTTPHPIAVLSADQVVRRAEQLLPAVVDRLTVESA